MKKRELSDTLGGNINWCSPMKNGMELPQKTKNKTTIWSSNPIPGNIPRKNYNSKRHMYPYVHKCTIHNSQNVATTHAH